jgi:uncharacterized protein (DUF58 family)
MRSALPFLAVLLAVAFFTKVDAFFYLLYVLVGVLILGRLWARRSLAAVSVERHYDHRVFLGQAIPVDLEVRNRGWLPVLWLRLGDSVPNELMPGPPFRRALSLLPHERQTLHYTLHGRRRGYYEIGPLVGLGGDLLGTASYESEQLAKDPIVVYPKIVPLRDLGFPSQSPFGTLASRERIFEDPSRIQGVRDYQPGDSLRRMDWKTTARVGVLQVRRYEPAIALETALFLNLNAADYPGRERYTAAELAIVVAASVAAHLVELRQAVGLVTNGRDPFQALSVEGSAPTLSLLPLRKGREHLMRLLDLLARIEVAAEGQAIPFLDLVNRKSLGLPWGSTVLLITAREAEGLFDTLLALRRRGLEVTLVLTCPDRGFARLAQRAGQIGVQALVIRSEKAMDVWR